MSPTRIHTIKKIGNYRIFQNWKPSGGVEFGRVNLIYGDNGSGKSTLASLLQGCAKYANDEFAANDHECAEITAAGLEIEVCEGSGSEGSGNAVIGWGDRVFWERVRVFNKDFVRRNLRFETAEGPQAEALLTLGERLADAEKEIDGLRKKLNEAQKYRQEKERESNATQKAIEELSKEAAKRVVDDLPGVSGYGGRSYTRTKVIKLLDESEGEPTVLGGASTDLSADRNLATGRPMRALPKPQRGAVLEREGLDEARQLLATSVVSSRLIEEIVGHPDRSRWVQDGIDLHEGLDECLFCGQELTADRRDALNAHFDESIKMLQSRIDKLVQRLNGSVEASAKFLGEFLMDNAVYDDLIDDLSDARSTYRAEHEVYSKVVDEIVAALNEKKNSPFGTPGLRSDVTLVAPSVVALSKVVAAHQGRVDRHAEEAKEAAKRVELYHVNGIAKKYQDLKDERQAASKARDEYEAQVKDLEAKIAALENVEGDPVPGARELTKGLRGLLGRDDLEFSARDAKHYDIKRHGAPATHLSEGEQTAIALLYFLSSVRKDKIQGDPPIVVIDDPVSSLDHGILFGASAHIWAELVVNPYASQMFLLTHDFDLFRHWLIQLEGRRQHEGCDYNAYEVTSKHAQRGSDVLLRCPQLRRWETDKDRSRVLRSEYHFLFSRVAHAVADRHAGESPADQMNELALMPNAARRMLEAFLSFRCPGQVGTFHVAVEELMGRCEDLDPTVRTRVERYLHTYSHFDGGDVSRPLDLTEATVVLRSLFQLMNIADPDHVSSMCQALAIDEERLLSNPAVSFPGAGTA